MNKKFVYQVGNNKKVILWCTANQIKKNTEIHKQDIDWSCFRLRQDGIFQGLGYNTTHSWTRYHVDVSVQIRVPTALPLRDLHQYPLKRRLDGPKDEMTFRSTEKYFFLDWFRTLDGPT